jgi:glycosyltransferase involved in cell wall biosynthesis
MSKYRFHVPCLPGQPVTRENSICAFTAKCRRFATMMADRGHEVTIYGDPRHADTGEAQYVGCYPEMDPPEFTAEAWEPYNVLAADAIKKNLDPERDFICMIGGRAQAGLCEALPGTICVEFGIGYAGTYSPYRVFESYAWMHTVYGAYAHDAGQANGHFFDAVIPAYFDPEDFICRQGEGDYLLYLGRLTERKGISTAEAVAEATGMPLLLAGAGEYVPQYGECIGNVGPDDRRELLADAVALLAPTTYVEPFGFVAVEASFSGTPVITTDWGAFTETVVPGLNGYRCRSLAEFKWAVEQAPTLKPKKMRKYAEANYSVGAVAPLYEAYFDQLQTLWGDGWQADRHSLDKIERYRRTI